MIRWHVLHHSSRRKSDGYSVAQGRIYHRYLQYLGPGWWWGADPLHPYEGWHQQPDAKRSRRVGTPWHPMQQHPARYEPLSTTILLGSVLTLPRHVGTIATAINVDDLADPQVPTLLRSHAS